MRYGDFNDIARGHCPFAVCTRPRAIPLAEAGNHDPCVRPRDVVEGHRIESAAPAVSGQPTPGLERLVDKRKIWQIGFTGDLGRREPKARARNRHVQILAAPRESNGLDLRRRGNADRAWNRCSGYVFAFILRVRNRNYRITTWVSLKPSYYYKAIVPRDNIIGDGTADMAAYFEKGRAARSARHARESPKTGSGNGHRQGGIGSSEGNTCDFRAGGKSETSAGKQRSHGQAA